MINFVVVEDNEVYRKNIVEMIVNYMMKNKYEFKIHEFDDYNKSLSNYIVGSNYNNLYILDFDLPSGSAIDISREIRDTDWVSPILVLTAYSSLALDTFKKRLQILDFISKDEDTEMNLNEIFKLSIHIFKLHEHYTYTYKNVVHSISMRNILYVMRDGRRVEIVTDTNTYYQNISVCEIKNLLGKSFVYSTKGVLINMERVKELDWKEMFVMFDNGLTKSLISKSHRKEMDSYDCV